MTAQPYFQPKFLLNHMGAKLVNMSTDTFQFGLIASGALATRTTADTYEFVSDLLANGGSALTEVSTSGTAYTRQALTSLSWSASGLVVTFSSAALAWPGATFSCFYGWIHDETASSGTDATRPLVTIFDFGGLEQVSASTFTLNIAGAGLATLTMAQ